MCTFYKGESLFLLWMESVVSKLLLGFLTVKIRHFEAGKQVSCIYWARDFEEGIIC